MIQHASFRDNNSSCGLCLVTIQNAHIREHRVVNTEVT
jgi:hypothetical protein